MSVSGKCYKRAVSNSADEDAERRRHFILRKNVHSGNEKKEADNAAACVAICSVKAQVNTPTFPYASEQKFNVWFGVTFLSDNATRLVEHAAEMRQPIQKSNFCRI